jgi:hypothetical protein
VNRPLGLALPVPEDSFVIRTGFRYQVKKNRIQIPCVEKSGHGFATLLGREEEHPLGPEASEHDVETDDDGRQEREQLGQAGINVMIVIFCDFDHFLRF